MQETLKPKHVECNCGNSFEATKLKTWCQKCCQPVFYHEKDQRKHKFNNYYIITMVVMVLMFISYLFVELIARPLLTL
jgi:predicted nucleic acid-binding Zn ribbon protein